MALRMTRWLLVALLCLVVWPGMTHGQSSALIAAINRYSELYTQGRYEASLPFAKNALKLSEQEFGPDNPITTSLNNLAGLYQDQGHFAEAEPLYERSLAVWEKALRCSYVGGGMIVRFPRIYRISGECQLQ
jgi:tetratricopeptide (TPR) repeat protein